MFFKTIKISEGFFSKTFSFTENINQIYSEFNSAGKTTLLRLILYSIGYNVPSTKKMDFAKCNTEVTIILDNKDEVNVLRLDSELTVTYPKIRKKYFLPYEHINFLESIFGTANEDILVNLLGTFYLDQERGWTLLNKGYVIGHIPFDLKQLIRGLTNQNCSELISELDTLKGEIQKYKKMLSIAEYQRQIDTAKGKIVSSSANDETANKLAVLYYDKNQAVEELKQIDQIINEQNSFRKYIERMHLVIETPYGEFPVNKNNIKGFRDLNEFAEARKRLKLLEIKKIEGKIKQIQISVKKEEQITDVKTLIQTFDDDIAKIPLDYFAIANVLNRLQNKKSAIEKQISAKTNADMDFINSFYKIAYKYLCNFGMEDYATEASSYLFTKNLKSLSGAVLQLTVLAFKLAYITVIKQTINITLPLIIDSPRGRELDQINIKKITQVLEKDFSDHQIIIASIYQDVASCNYIKLKDYLLNNDVD